MSRRVFHIRWLAEKFRWVIHNFMVNRHNSGAVGVQRAGDESRRDAMETKMFYKAMKGRDMALTKLACRQLLKARAEQTAGDGAPGPARTDGVKA